MHRTRIAHLADLHLGAGHEYLGSRSAARQEDADGLLDRLVDYVLQAESGIGGVLIAGDLFDTHDPSPRLAEQVIHQLGRLESAGVRTCTVPGNHDEYSYPNSVYRRWEAQWPGVLVKSPAVERVARWNLDGFEVDLYAMAYTASRSRPPYDQFVVEPGPGRKVAVLHGSLDAPWTDRSLPLRSENLATLDIDYFALGHIHKPSERRVGKGWTCYPGRIEGCGFDDPGGAGVVVIDLAASELRPERLPFPSQAVRTERWNLSGLSSEEELEARLESLADPRAIVRVILSGSPGFPLREERLLLQFRERFFYLEVCSDEIEAAPFDLEEAAAEPTVRGLFAQIAAGQMAAAPESQRALHAAALRFGWAAFRDDPGSAERPGGRRRT